MPREDTQFKPGESGNPAGRPKGSRNTLSEAFLKALCDDFVQNGVQAIEDLRKESVKDYVGAVNKLMPKLMELSGPDGGDIPTSGKVVFVNSKKDDADSNSDT